MFGAAKQLYRVVNHYYYTEYMQCIVPYLSKCGIVILDINECSDNGCMNGATCTDAVNAYTCACVAGYTGTHCEKSENLGLSNFYMLPRLLSLSLAPSLPPLLPSSYTVLSLD